MLNKIAKVLKAVRDTTPLVQAITNYVTINDCANILLCIGHHLPCVKPRMKSGSL